MDNQQLAINESTRQNIYETLVKCYHLPTQSLKDNLLGLQNNLEKIESKAIPYVSNMISDMERRSVNFLSVDFTRLFIGPYSLPAPPYGSVYMENKRKIMGDSTMDALNRYRTFGLAISEGVKEVPDHISIELEFMFFLIYKEVNSILYNDPESSQVYIAEQLSFLEDHLYRWVPPFAGSMIEYSGTEFFRSLGKATQLFIEEDYQFLTDICKAAAIK